MMVIEVDRQLPVAFHLAHLLPPEENGHKWKSETFRHAREIPYRFDEFIRELEQDIER